MKFTSTIKSVIPADIRVVWQVVTSLENYAWRSDISRIEKEDEESFTEYTTSGIATRFIVTSLNRVTVMSLIWKMRILRDIGPVCSVRRSMEQRSYLLKRYRSRNGG